MRRHSAMEFVGRGDGVSRRRGRRPRPQRRHRLARAAAGVVGRAVRCRRRAGRGAGVRGRAGDVRGVRRAVRRAGRRPGRRSSSDAVGVPRAPAALADKTLSFGEFLRAEKLVLRADLLRPWANWVTPKEERTRRYDTYFFVGALPEGQRADGDNTETDKAGWATPQSGARRLRRRTQLPAAADLDPAGLAGRPHRRRGAGRRASDRRRRAAPGRRPKATGRSSSSTASRYNARAAAGRAPWTADVSEFVCVHTACGPARGRHAAAVAAADQHADPPGVPRDQRGRRRVARRDDIAAVILFGGHEIFSRRRRHGRTADADAPRRPDARRGVRHAAIDAVAAIPKPTVAADHRLRAGQRPDAGPGRRLAGQRGQREVRRDRDPGRAGAPAAAARHGWPARSATARPRTWCSAGGSSTPRRPWRWA